MNEAYSANATSPAVSVEAWIRDFDWSNTVLGSRETWGASVNSTVNLAFLSKTPTVVLLGNDHVAIYNESFRELTHQQLSQSFAKPIANTIQLWSTLRPLVHLVHDTREAQLARALPLELTNHTSLLYADCSLTPIVGDEGKIRGVFLTLTNAFDQAITLRELRNKQLENLFLQAPIAICILKGDGFIIETANEKMLELWGKTANQAIDKPVFEAIPDARNQGYEDLLHKVYNRGERIIFDEFYMSLIRNGKAEDIYVKFVYEPLQEEDGSISGVMVLADDISEQVRNRKKVEESEERLRLAIESTHVGTWDYKPLTGELNWSEECRKIYAIPAGQQVDIKTFSEHIFPADRDFVESEIAKAMVSTGPGTYDITYRITRFDDGSTRWITAKGRVFFNAAQQAERFVGTVVDITEHKLLEETLIDSELRTRLAIEASALGTFDWDIKRDHFQYSDRLAEIFGYTDPKGLKQSDFSRRIHPEDVDERLKAHEIAFVKGKLFYEARVIWPDDSVHWVRLNGKVVFDESGNPLRMYGTTGDITAQKAYAEKLEREVMKRTQRLQERNLELKQSEERYHKMVDEVQDYAIILLDRDGFIKNWNLGAEKIKQYSEEEILGKHFSIFYLPEDLQNTLPQRLINEAVSQGRAAQEGWRKRKDGSRFWSSISITALHDDHNQVIGFSKVTRDLTDKKITEEELRISNEELRMSEERYHQMIAEIQDYAIILLNIDGDIQNWNAGAEFIKGYKGTEIIGKNFEIFYTPEDREQDLPKKLLKQVAESGRASHEGWRVRKDGTKFWGAIVITALHNKKGELIGYSKVTRDLTEKKSAEDKLIRYASELESQNKELEQFAYIASHDLQEPLRKIQTFAELIQDNLNDEQLVKRYFEKIHDSAKRMSALIKSVLNFSKLSRIETEAVDVDLNITLAAVQSDFELLISEKHAVIAVEHLPTIKGIPLHLSQLFANLIGNGLKFSQQAPRIDIRSRIVAKSEIVNAPETLEEKTYIEISIADNGIGFDQQYEKLIFQMFKRLHGKQHYAGTGIGLALCKKIVENHHGYIAATAELGKGATFYVYFPS